ncbi:MAG: NAD-dependent epimerase/dehydratase family protein [Thermoanaerobaculia bacterium]|nr:NAD-dependent epimerase/dehydratase family protein [Thermoanaerobaculia bacterium]
MSKGDLVAVTGGTGFVGSHAVDALLAGGYRVRALVRRPESPGWLKSKDVEIVPGDVRRPESLDALVRGASAVVHVAGKTSARSEIEYMAANAGGTENVVAAVRKLAPGAHLVLVSSQAAGGPSANGEPVRAGDSPRPVSAYGRSKLAGEEAVRKAPDLAFTVLRPSAVYGPRETAIRDLFVAASKGFVPVVAGGIPRVQMAFAEDVAAAVSGALARGGRGETFFAAHPEILDYRRIAETLAGLPTRRPMLLPIPGAAVRAAGFLAGVFLGFGKGPPVFNAAKASELLQRDWICDVSEAQVALGQPFRTDFASGARRTWEWYLERGWIVDRGGKIHRTGEPNDTASNGAAHGR